MKMQPDRLDGANMISRLDGPTVWIHQTAFEGSVVVPHRGSVLAWAPRALGELSSDHLEVVVGLRPELVILGVGRRLRFPPPAILRPLVNAGIGWEVMDTAAACRTYNVLASEGRSVVAALVVEDSST
jgi:uncharacterized protein